jgi:glycine/serine hydroxymethyltransferase
MGEAEMAEIGAIIAEALAARGDRAVEEKLAARTRVLTSRFPVPGL